MVLPPAAEGGLGIMLLNSTAETHFSFTNALGLVSSAQARALLAIAARYPKAHWIVALHHHLVEYPKLGSALSERIGTALINGSWFSRQLQPLGRRAVVMHGHRHIDWIGTCGSLTHHLRARHRSWRRRTMLRPASWSIAWPQAPKGASDCWRPSASRSRECPAMAVSAAP